MVRSMKLIKTSVLSVSNFMVAIPLRHYTPHYFGMYSQGKGLGIYYETTKTL